MADIASIGHGQSPLGPMQRSASSGSSSNGQVSSRHQRLDDVRQLNAGDRVEVSERAQLIARLRELPEVRTERIEAARKAIEDPDYLNDERLNVALGRMLQDISQMDEL